MITFFISSTFKDMQAERDIIQDNVFPRLRKLAAAYGEDVTELDLRWGVDTLDMTEEESSRKVLNVCIDALDRCVPYFIVLLGERYGWIPDLKDVYNADDRRINDHYSPNMSITNLEIEYAIASQHNNWDHCVFCLRDPNVITEIEPEYQHIYESESDLHKQQLQNLKSKIRTTEAAKTINYQASWNRDTHQLEKLESFADALYNCLAEMLISEIESTHTAISANWKEQIRLEAQHTRCQHTATYVSRIFDEYTFLYELWCLRATETSGKANYNACIYLQAPSGMGKTAFMSHMAQVIEQQGYHTISYYSGNSGCHGVQTLKEYLIYELERFLDIPHTAYEDVDTQLMLLNNSIDKGNVICFVDALDQLLKFESNSVIDLPALCPGILFVFSSLDSFTAAFHPKTKIRPITLCELSIKQVQQIIVSTLKKRGKHLNNEIVTEILTKANCTNPLYLSLLLQRFLMLRGEDYAKAEALAPGMMGIHLYMKALLDEFPNDRHRAPAYLIDEAISRFKDPDFLRCINMIAICNYGLSDNELKEIMSLENGTLDALDFVQLTSFLYDAFQQTRSGKWIFAHREYLKSIDNRISSAQRAELLAMLRTYSIYNKAFCIQTGYEMLFSAKDPRGYIVFELISEDDNISYICQYIENSLQNPEYMDYYFMLAQNHPSDHLCRFWNEIAIDYINSDIFRKLRLKILEFFLDSPSICVDNKIRICKNLICNYLSLGHMNAQKYLALFQNLRDNSNPLCCAEYYYFETRIASELLNDKALAAEALAMSAEYLEHIPKGSLANKDIGSKVAMVLYVYDQNPTPAILESLLDELKESDYILYHALSRVMLDIYCRFVRYYLSPDHFDASKFSQYRKEGTELAENLVTQKPLRANYMAYAQFLMCVQNTYQQGYRASVYKKIYSICDIISKYEEREDVRYLKACCCADHARDMIAGHYGNTLEAVKQYAAAYTLFCGCAHAKEDSTLIHNRIICAADCLEHCCSITYKQEIENQLSKLLSWGKDIWQEAKRFGWSNQRQGLLVQFKILSAVMRLSFKHSSDYEEIDVYITELKELNTSLYTEKTQEFRGYLAWMLEFYQLLADFELKKDDTLLSNCRHFLAWFDVWKKCRFAQQGKILFPGMHNIAELKEPAMMMTVLALVDNDQMLDAHKLNEEWLEIAQNRKPFIALKEFIENADKPNKMQYGGICLNIGFTLLTHKRWNSLKEYYLQEKILDRRGVEIKLKLGHAFSSKQYPKLTDEFRPVLIKMMEQDNLIITENCMIGDNPYNQKLQALTHYALQEPVFPIPVHILLQLARYNFITYRDKTALIFYNQLERSALLTPADNAACLLLHGDASLVSEVSQLLHELENLQEKDIFLRTVYYRSYISCFKVSSEPKYLTAALQCNVFFEGSMITKEDSNYLTAYDLLLNAIKETKVTVDALPSASYMQIFGALPKLAKALNDDSLTKKLIQLRWHITRILSSSTTNRALVTENVYSLMYFSKQDMSATASEFLRLVAEIYEFVLSAAEPNFLADLSYIWCDTYCRAIIELYTRSADMEYIEKIHRLVPTVLKHKAHIYHKSVIFSTLHIAMNAYQRMAAMVPNAAESYWECLTENIKKLAVSAQIQILESLKGQSQFTKRIMQLQKTVEENSTLEFSKLLSSIQYRQ